MGGLIHTIDFSPQKVYNGLLNINNSFTTAFGLFKASKSKAVVKKLPESSVSG